MEVPKASEMSEEVKRELWQDILGHDTPIPEDFDSWWDNLLDWEKEALLYK